MRALTSREVGPPCRSWPRCPNPNAFVSDGAAQLQNTRNVVWGNTFVPGPTPGYSGIYSPTRYLAGAEDFDRFYNNEFNALATNSPTNLSVSDTGTSIDWFNATCVSGYKPLSQETYPGTGPTGVCEPLSYSQSIDGIAMTGAIDGATYQGGNAWSDYGNEPNPYANIPFVARTTTETGTAGISAAVTGAFAFRSGDYAPLIDDLGVGAVGARDRATELGDGDSVRGTDHELDGLRVVQRDGDDGVDHAELLRALRDLWLLGGQHAGLRGEPGDGIGGVQHAIPDRDGGVLGGVHGDVHGDGTTGARRAGM